MMKESEGTPQMIKIAAAVRKGAMSYLKQQYKIVGWVFLDWLFCFHLYFYGFHVQNAWVPIAFLLQADFSPGFRIFRDEDGDLCVGSYR